MLAILEAARSGALPMEPAVVVSDRLEAAGLEKARSMGVPAVALDFKGMGDPEAYHRRLHEELTQRGVQWVAAAGYMRILPPWFVRAWQGRLVNIHPSLLPSFPGLRPQRQAIEHGVKISGCTVHFIDDQGVDTGPIILQRAVPVFEDDTPESLAERILVEEHQAYPEALALLASGRVRLEGRRVRIAPGGIGRGAQTAADAGGR